MAHQATNEYSAGFTQIGGGLSTCTNAVACGSGANRVVLVIQFRRPDRAIAIQSVTLGGESMTVLGSDVAMSNYVARTFAIVNPTVENTQNLVVTATTNGSNSISNLIVAVYDGVDTAAVEADLLVASNSGTITTPWTGDASVSVPSATGAQVVAMARFFSGDVSFTLPESGITERYFSVGGGVGGASGDAAGAATVNVAWSANGGGLTQDCYWATFGFSLPPPNAAALLPSSLVRGAAVVRGAFF